jgi:hypothetical protein
LLQQTVYQIVDGTRDRSPRAIAFFILLLPGDQLCQRRQLQLRLIPQLLHDRPDRRLRQVVFFDQRLRFRAQCEYLGQEDTIAFADG